MHYGELQQYTVRVINSRRMRWGECSTSGIHVNERHVNFGRKTERMRPSGKTKHLMRMILKWILNR